MKHSEVRGHMADYLEGDLELTRRALVDAHLDACDRCRGELTELRRTIDLVRALPEPEPPVDLADQVMRRIRAGEGRVRALDRVREWLHEAASPRIALPVTLVAGGLLLATGRLDVSVESLTQLLRGEDVTSRPVAARAQGASSGAAAGVPGALSPTPGWRPSPLVVAHREPRVPRISLQMQLAEVGSQPLRPGSQLGDGSFRMVRQTRAGQTQLAGPLPVGSPIPRPAATPIPESRALDTRGDALDARLEQLVLYPRSLALQFDALTVGEQEIWLEAMAEHALAAGRSDQVLSSLRAVGDSRALSLATAFSAEIDRLVGDDAGADAAGGVASSAEDALR